MNRKAENEYKQLVKLGVPDETARLIAVSKYNPDSEESKALIEEEKELQCEIQRFISEFIRVEDSTRQLHCSEKIDEESKEEKLISLNDIFG